MAIGIGTAFGVGGLAEEKQTLTELVMAVATGVAGLLAVYGRVKAKSKIKLKMLPIFLALALLVGGCDRPGMSVWTMTGQNTDVKTRLGADFDGIELGGTLMWSPSDDIEWGPEPSGVGGYVAVEASWLVQSVDTETPAPPPISWLTNLIGIPYGAIEFVDIVDNDNVSNLQPQWIAGTKFKLDPEGIAAIVVEYSDGDTLSGEVFIGGLVSF
jgi:hypothetical protein